MIYLVLYVAIGIMALAGIAKLFEMYNGEGRNGLIKFVKDCRKEHPGHLYFGTAFAVLAWPYLLVATIIILIRSIFEIHRLKKYITKPIITEESSE